MLFNSYIFVFVYFPLVLLFWYGINRIGKPRLAQIFLVLLSLLFYGYGHPEYVCLILVSVCVNYGLSRAMEYLEMRAKGRDACRMRQICGVLGIVFDLGLLFYFKYYDFFVQNINRLADIGLQMQHRALPLGISFFTFQQISFLADRMRGTAPHYALLDYMNFVTFFPQLVAGPIVNHRDLAPQFQKIAGDARSLWKRPHWVHEGAEYSSFEMGLCLFILGLSKKVLLADKLGVVVDYGYAHTAALDAVSAFVVMLGYTFQIYYDFSGYCDMAVGIGWMLHIDLPQNFNSPYQAASVKEFWNRWHITLNAFFTQYVYIPLGGSRRGMVRRFLNIMLVFLLSGIWHGAAWSFVLWGVLHGLMMCAEPLLAKRKRSVRWLLTFSFVNLTWVLFRSGSFDLAMQFYQKLFSFTNTGYLWELAAQTESSWNYPVRLWILAGGGSDTMLSGYNMVILIFLFLMAIFLSTRRNAYEKIRIEGIGGIGMWALAGLFVLCVCSFSGVTAFLYFNF